MFEGHNSNYIYTRHCVCKEELIFFQLNSNINCTWQINITYNYN